MADAPRRVRVYVAEDEEPARRTVRALLEEDDELEFVGEGYGEQALREVVETSPDLLLLDVRMPGMNGFELLQALPGGVEPDVVFITAYDEYAVEAFEVRALDYLLKPFTDRRFHEAVRRAKDRIRRGRRQEAPRLEEAGEPWSGALRNRRLVLDEGGRTLLIPLDEIAWIEASGTYSTVHGDGGSYVVRITMSELEEKLAGRGFCRIHRSSIVRVDAIREVRSLSHGDALVVLENGTKLRLTRSRRDDLEQALGG